jgi:hypothetical protein
VTSGKCAPFRRNVLPPSLTAITEAETVIEFPLNVCQNLWTHTPEGTTISYDNCYFKTQFLPAVYMQCIQHQSPCLITSEHICKSTPYYNTQYQGA